MNTRRNETIGCNLVNGRGSRDEHGPGGRYNQLYNDEIETYSEWIAWLERANQPFPRASSFLSAIYIYSLAISPAASPFLRARVKKMGNRSKSDPRGRGWPSSIHPAIVFRQLKNIFSCARRFLDPFPSKRSDSVERNFSAASFAQETNSSRSRERERERMESEIFCRSILNEQTNEKRSGRSEKQWEERKVGGAKTRNSGGGSG